MRSLISLAVAAAALPFSAYAVPPPISRSGQSQGKYIVIMHPAHEVTHLGFSRKGSAFQGIAPTHTYNSDSMKGFAAHLTSSQVEAIKSDSRVAYIERDGVLHTQDIRDAALVRTETNATWGLGRISHRAKGRSDYLYDSSAGAGACAYIIDTGIRVNHTEFGGRATFVRNYDRVDGTDDDLFGHGTHVAGTIGSESYGVAKRASLFAMKVCDQFGSCDVSAVNQAILDTITDSARRSCPSGVVINMSLGAPNDEWKSIKTAVKAAADAGIFVAVAAGNSATDSKDFTPANAQGACAAGAADKDDRIADFSNFGKPVKVFAPGVDVLSTYNDGKTTMMSGTSMASPHVAGMAAYLLGLNGKQDPAKLCSYIAETGTKDVLTGIPAGTVNLLAFNGEQL